jgi:anti-anti-sigma factor
MNHLDELLGLDHRAPMASALPVVEIKVVEPLDVSTLHSFHDQLEDALSLRPERLTVDLTECAYIDAQAIRVLIDAHCDLYALGGRLVLRGVRSSTRRLLGLAGVGDVFSVEDATSEGA